MSKLYQGVVLEKKNITEDLISLKFKASQRIPFEPGQFLSLVVPAKEGLPSVKRAYSFALGPNHSEKQGYELCIRLVHGGRSARFLETLSEGGRFEFYAPYGEFRYRSSPSKSVVWIATGSGIAPFRTFLESSLWHSEPPQNSLLLFGARTLEQLLYPGEFEAQGVQRVNCVSRSSEPGAHYFQGRVTDYLRQLPLDWLWKEADFYMCGGSEMVQEVRHILMHERGVSDTSIFEESFSPAVFLKEAA